MSETFLLVNLMTKLSEMLIIFILSVGGEVLATAVSVPIKCRTRKLICLCASNLNFLELSYNNAYVDKLKVCLSIICFLLLLQVENILGLCRGG